LRYAGLMLGAIRREWQAKVAIGIFIFFSVWWLILQYPQTKTESLNSAFGATYGIIALWGAICGLIISRLWGGAKSIMGKAIIVFSLGLLLQEFGQLSYFYYFFIKHVDVPYPSLGDIGYFGSVLMYIYGAVLLANAAGVHFTLRSIGKKIQAIAIPVIMLLVGYYLFLKGYQFDWGNPIKVFLDFGYPLGQAVYVSIAVLTYLLAGGILGGIMRSKVLWILFALIAQFAADYTFLYQTNNGTWTAGQINDYMYLFAYFIMALALIQLRGVLREFKK
jgi:hypothetical protein